MTRPYGSSPVDEPARSYLSPPATTSGHAAVRTAKRTVIGLVILGAAIVCLTFAFAATSCPCWGDCPKGRHLHGTECVEGGTDAENEVEKKVRSSMWCWLTSRKCQKCPVGQILYRNWCVESPGRNDNKTTASMLRHSMRQPILRNALEDSISTVCA
mmetsp:Transcript_12185/g.35265  ORF Transcript_12185/g.35265 Transcript_12185/m.35265 type:complete len:157 (+) Transcript_12185:262-732(+)